MKQESVIVSKEEFEEMVKKYQKRALDTLLESTNQTVVDSDQALMIIKQLIKLEFTNKEEEIWDDLNKKLKSTNHFGK